MVEGDEDEAEKVEAISEFLLSSEACEDEVTNDSPHDY